MECVDDAVDECARNGDGDGWVRRAEGAHGRAILGGGLGRCMALLVCLPIRGQASIGLLAPLFSSFMTNGW